MAPLRAKPSVEQTGKKAVVLGATGAAGRYVVKALVTRPQWTKVILIGRREFDPEYFKLNIPEEDMKKVEQVVVKDLVEDYSSYADKFQGADSVFSCFGATLKKDWGNTDYIEHAEVTLSSMSARGALEGKVPHTFAITMMGATKNSPRWKSCFLLYFVNALGRKQELFTHSKIPHVTIFRPAALDKSTLEGDGKQETSQSAGPLNLEELGLCAVLDAERIPDKDEPGKKSTRVLYSGNGAIRKNLEEYKKA